MSPVSPYHFWRPAASGSALNAPLGCLSKPTAIPMSNWPDLIVVYADSNAEPPVAQPFETFINGTPVRPNSLTIVSALPAADDPP